VSRLITELQLDLWVRSYPSQAELVIPDLAWRLVRQSCPDATRRRFPTDDAINQPGLDGILATENGCAPFVPAGTSCWEIGVGTEPATKATNDYTKRTTGEHTAVPEFERTRSTFVFVSPLSAQKSWRKESQSEWLTQHKAKNDWVDVRIIDGTIIIDWLKDYPDIELWLAGQMGMHVEQIKLAGQHWERLSSVGSFPLTPGLYLTGREEAQSALERVFAHEQNHLEIDTYSPGEARDFLSAFVASKRSAEEWTAFEQCLIISGREAFDEISVLDTPRVLFLDFRFSNDAAMTSAIARAEFKGNGIVFEGMPRGEVGSERVLLTKPRRYSVEEELKKAGYPDQQARSLARECDQDLASLLRLIQGIDAGPDWSQNDTSADLALAQLVGAWREDYPLDKEAVATVAGRDYAVWGTRLGGVVARAGSPLVRDGGIWQFVARYEGWRYLGPLIHDEDLRRLEEGSIGVLSERNPGFDLPPDRRFAASIYGKKFAHSSQLRNGLAATLALLGSHPQALTCCTTGSAEGTAGRVVRKVLSEPGWERWASLDDVLPLLAEAAPSDLLDMVDKALRDSPCPFDGVFAQEAKGLLTSHDYMTGCLWALEELAWNQKYFPRVVDILGELASHDPKEKSGSGPGDSLSTILRPASPQTTASLSLRRAAVEALCHNQPAVAWNLLVSLLPQMRLVSGATHRPVWQTTWIPGNWRDTATSVEYSDAISAYVELTIDMAEADSRLLVELLEHSDNLPDYALTEVLDYIASNAAKSLSDECKASLWDRLMKLIAENEGVRGPQRAASPEMIKKIEFVAETIAPVSPFYKYRHLFTDNFFDLFDGRGSFEEQEERVDQQKQEAVHEVCGTSGYAGLLTFVHAVEAPFHVGLALGAYADGTVDVQVLPSLLDSKDPALVYFLRGFIQRRYAVQSWPWVDALDYALWTPDQRALFLAYLPFVRDTWQRARIWLKDEEPCYWATTLANPYEPGNGLKEAAINLLRFGRPLAAARCLEHMVHMKLTIEGQLIIQTLMAVSKSGEEPRQDDGNAIAKLIEVLQGNCGADRAAVAELEWVFLPLLDGSCDVQHKALDHELAQNPDLFCQAIGMIFPSEKEKDVPQGTDRKQEKMAENSYRLLTGWHIPPGLHDDGTFCGAELDSWLDEVVRKCTEADRLASALDFVGRVLFYVPADPDGLWIDKSASGILDRNSANAEHLRSGFYVEAVNSQGAHPVDPSGGAERALADQYRRQASDLDMHTFTRFAASIREIAAYHDLEAKEIVEHIRRLEEG